MQWSSQVGGSASLGRGPATARRRSGRPSYAYTRKPTSSSAPTPSTRPKISATTNGGRKAVGSRCTGSASDVKSSGRCAGVKASRRTAWADFTATQVGRTSSPDGRTRLSKRASKAYKGGGQVT